MKKKGLAGFVISATKSVLAIGIIALTTLLLSEAAIKFLLDHPQFTAGGLRYNLQQYYLTYDRKLAPFVPDCGRFDEELFYTLKPGHCRIDYREHTTDYFINSAGVRDDDVSLKHPSVIVLGDSQAMGWAVDQDQTFADLLEDDLHQTVLNAAIASYGTAREVTALNRYQTDKLHYLIIQYCDNDLAENMSFWGKEKLPISSRAFYNLTAAGFHKFDYYLGKHSHLLFKQVLSSLGHANAGSLGQTDQREAILFVDALKKIKIDMSNVKLIVFEINSSARNDSRFVSELRTEKAKPENPEWIRNMTVLDLSPVLTEDVYYILDDHIKAEGHQRVEKALMKEMSKSVKTQKSKSHS